jgi:hypothetical protein
MWEIQRPVKPQACPECGNQHIFARIIEESPLASERQWTCWLNGHEIGESWLEPSTLAILENDPAADFRHAVLVTEIGIAFAAGIASLLFLSR